jgi:hypothetical protein
LVSESKVKAWSSFDSISTIPGVVIVVEGSPNVLDYSKERQKKVSEEINSLFHLASLVKNISGRIEALPKAPSFEGRETFFIDNGINIAASRKICEAAERASSRAKETFTLANEALSHEAEAKMIYLENKDNNSACLFFEQVCLAVSSVLEADMNAVKNADRAIAFARVSKAIVAPLIAHEARSCI